ncbi:MAG TPA: zinc-ribbon domain-containing protein, partial [Actinomycetota bacterium]|nr:zinc-ribbon domain-containing protein [Actinomycetota bacterium]
MVATGPGTSRRCPSCGTEALAGQRFCRNCGTDLEAAAAAETTPMPPAIPAPPPGPPMQQPVAQ